MDWVDPISSEPAKEREDDMSNLVARFSTWMRLHAKRSRQAGADFATSSRLFMNLGCPPVPTAIKATAAEMHHSEGLHMGQQARHRFRPVL